VEWLLAKQTYQLAAAQSTVSVCNKEILTAQALVDEALREVDALLAATSLHSVSTAIAHTTIRARCTAVRITVDSCLARRVYERYRCALQHGLNKTFCAALQHGAADACNLMQLCQRVDCKSVKQLYSHYSGGEVASCPRSALP
jgi:hypothetical protein